MGNKSGNLKYFTTWEKQNLEQFTKEGEPTVRMITEYNHYYGDIVVAFQIGEEQSNTGVKCRYYDSFLLFQEQDNLIGERAFENGSITYEFLYKPLGLHSPDNKFYTGFDYVTKALEEIGYKHTRIYKNGH